MTLHGIHRHSEEDIRGKVVLTWLAGLGFHAADIQLESSFEVPLGRKRLRVDSTDRDHPGYLHPRADVLVRHVDGRNLLIVEVKAPDEPLDDNARKQGISYARLLQDGGIAPFVVLTNGTESRIFDTITAEELQGTSVPQNHRHVTAGFRVVSDVLELRADALEHLISLSPANLLAFCEAQVAFRMRKLRSEDAASGRKYIPGLYIERPTLQQHLDNLIAQGRRTVLLVGAPQVGKTNLMCRTAERRLKDGQPTLFYSAGAIGSLLDELREDFEWTFRQGTNTASSVAIRLAKVVRATGRRLVILIDGWNEATIESARLIDYYAARFASDCLSFVVSLTDVSANRLLIDNVGDPSFFADESGLSGRELQAMESKWWRMPAHSSVVRVGNYEREEMVRAYGQYSSLLKVEVSPSHEKVNDPLLLQAAMLACQGSRLPDSLDGPTWINRIIETKLARARLREPRIGDALLLSAAEELLLHGSPVREDRLAARWGIPLTHGLPDGLFEAALLARRGRGGDSSGIDFYSDRERDYIIAYRVRKWPLLLGSSMEDMRTEIETAARTEIGRAALRWFLEQHENRPLLRRCFNELSLQADLHVHRVLLQTLQKPRFMITTAELPDQQLKSMILANSHTPNFDLLETLVTGRSDEFPEYLCGERELVRSLLRFNHRFPFEVGKTGELVLHVLSAAHSCESGWTSYEEPSDLTNILIELAADPEYASAALKAFGYVAPHVFFSWLNERLPAPGPLDEKVSDMYLSAVENAAEQMFEPLYTVFNREGGVVDFLRERDEGRARALRRHRAEYRKFRQLYEPLIRLWGEQSAGRRLQGYLDDLQPEEDKVPSAKQKLRRRSRRRQLRLKLEKKT